MAENLSPSSEETGMTEAEYDKKLSAEGEDKLPEIDEATRRKRDEEAYQNSLGSATWQTREQDK